MPNGERMLVRNKPLSRHTSLHVGGPAAYWCEPSCDPNGELASFLMLAAEAGRPTLILGDGTNVLCSDAGFPGMVLRLKGNPNGPLVQPYPPIAGHPVGAEVDASYPWDKLVARAVALGLQGVECLSGIPGTVGAAPVQNIGAYGQQVSDVIEFVDVLDRTDWQYKRLRAAQCGFGYRSSIFNGPEVGRYVITSVEFSFRHDTPGCRAYSQVADAVPEGATVQAVRDAVLGLRRHKGMLAGQHRSAGSFFKNPIVPVVDYPEEASAVFLADGRVKLSAAWLIERAGFPKGFTRGRVAVSPDHALALVSRDYATSSEVIALAREVQEKVAERFGVVLEPEVQLVGFDEYPLHR